MAILVVIAAIVFRFKDIRSWGIGSSSLSKKNLFVALAPGLLIVFQPLQNVARFGNPLYPVSMMGLPGTEGRMPTTIPYIPKAPLLTNSLSYIASVTEIDPIIRTKAGFSFVRSWHNHNLPRPGFEPKYPNYSWIVTGGSNGILFLCLFIGAFLSVASPLRIGRHPFEKTPLLILRTRLLLISFVFTFLPQSMELRYYIISLFSPALVAISGEPTKLRQLMRWIVVAGLWIAMYPSFLQPLYFRIRTGDWDHSRGLMSPDPYRVLPSADDCLESYKLWGGPSPTFPHRTASDIQTSLKCHLRMRKINK